MTRKLIAAFAAVLALAAAAPAFARETTATQGAYTQKSVAISPAGYTLDTPQGAERFARVVARAVRQVCDTGDSRSIVARQAQRTCEAQTMRTTLAALDKPYLSAALMGAGAPRILLASR